MKTSSLYQLINKFHHRATIRLQMQTLHEEGRKEGRIRTEGRKEGLKDGSVRLI